VSAFGYFMRGEKKLPAALRGLSAGNVKAVREVFLGSALGLLMLH